MRIRFIVAASLLALPLVGFAAKKERDSGASLAQRAQDNAQQITDADAFINEIDASIEMARAGEYGRLKKGTIVRIEMARNRIGELLDGHGNALELAPDERVELYNAQEMISSALRDDDKNRTVCKREMVTGSRLPRTECMSIAEREARAKAAREHTDKFIRNVCTPGEGNSCGQ